MVSGGGKLVHKVFGFNLDNELFGDLIGQANELGAESAFLQVIMTMFDPFEEFRCGSVFDGNSVNKIAIGIKHDKQILVTRSDVIG